MTGPVRAIATTCCLAVLAGPVAAQITNGGCESGLSGWTVTPGSSAEAVGAADFAAGTIVPPEGSFVCLLSTGPGPIPAAGGDFDANGVNDFDGSTIRTSFTTTVPDEALSLEWAFLTDEVGPGGQGQPRFDDLFEISIDGVPVITGSVNKPGGSSPYPDTGPYDGTLYTVASAGATDGSEFGTAPGGGRTPFSRMCLPIADPGAHTLELRVADQGDTSLDSGLMVDAIELLSDCDPRIQVTATAGSNLELKDGNFVFAQVETGRAATTFDGTRLAFRSNGDFNGDNPNLREQIWIADRAGTVYEIARITAQTAAETGPPDISRRGDWIVFSSTGDLVAGGNPDGNAEIFRHDVGGGGFLQITETTGCENHSPTVNEFGNRVAFVSNCSGGGDDVMWWDGTLRGAGTSGCTNRLPSISSDLEGRYVTFLTDCGDQYPGVTNPDGGNEIVQWDTTSDLFLQVTQTPAGFSTDLPTADDSGRFVALLSSADLDPGQNPAGSLAVFRYDRSTGTHLQLGADPLSVFTAASIDASGRFVAAERLDALTSSFEIVLFDADQPGTPVTISFDGPGVSQSSPVVAAGAGEALVHYLSNGDPTSTNPDRNQELWRNGVPFAAPLVGTYCSTPNLTLPDRGTVSDEITITDSAILTDVDVFVNVLHDWVGDLRVTLRHVDTGTQRRLMDRPGGPPGFGCSGKDIELTFDDEAATPAEDECVTPGPVAILGSFTPLRPLSDFDGEDLTGTWRLTVSDQAARASGLFVEWCLKASTP